MIFYNEKYVIMENKQCSISSCTNYSDGPIIGYSKNGDEIRYCNTHEYYWYLSDYLYNKEINELEENMYYIARKNPLEYFYIILVNFNMLSKTNSLYLIYISLTYLIKYIKDIELIKKFIKSRIMKKNREFEELKMLRNS